MPFSSPGLRSRYLGNCDSMEESCWTMHSELDLPLPALLHFSSISVSASCVWDCFSGTLAPLPPAANGFPSEWVAALKRAETSEATTFVPAHGLLTRKPGMTVAAVAAYRQALEQLISEGRRLHDERVPLSEAPSRVRMGEFASLLRYRENLPGALARVYAEVDGTLPD